MALSRPLCAARAASKSMNIGLGGLRGRPVQPRLATSLLRATPSQSPLEPQRRTLRTTAFALAPQQFKLADIGEGIAEVTVTEWFIKEGDMIKEMDNVCAVESDKASVELTSPYTGKVTKINYKVQDVVKVGSILIEVETAGGAAAPKSAPKAAAAPAPKASPAPAAAAAPSAAGGIKTFKLSDIGEGIAEVQLTEWYVKEGDMVKEMDNLCAVESDKASVDLSSPYTGKVKKIYAKVSDTVKVGGPLVDIEDSSAPSTPAPAAPAASKPAPAASAPPASGGGGGGVKEFKLADIGEGIAEVQLTEWMVKVGDKVKEMDVLCSVESDKASVELTSPFTGTVKKLACGTGSTVKVGSVLVEIETATGGPAADATPAKAPETSAEAPSTSEAATYVQGSAPPKPSSPRSSSPGAKAPGVLATPKVRNLAKQKGVDLNTVSGSGPLGRVLESDVLAALESSSAPSTAPSTPKAAPAAAAPARPDVRPGEEKVIEIKDGVGKGMVKSMIEALQMPTMSLGEEIDMTEMIKLQKAVKGNSEKQYGIKVTLTSFMVKAMSLALQEYPKINTKFGPPDASPPYYTQYGSHNVSIAIDTPGGLVVPNIKDCANLSVIEIQREIKRLAADAQAGKLKVADIQGGTITLSNIGVIGTKDPSPVPFGGQSVIGATGRTMKLPRYNEKMELEPRDIMIIRWVGDHRHLDGATLARFSNAFKKYMEEPAQWLLTMK